MVAEMRWLKEHYSPDHIWFMDDILGLKPGWLEHFAELLEQKDLRIPFKSLNRADLLLRGNTVDALRRAGGQEVWLGAESGSQKVLDAMEKGTQVEQVYAAARLLHEAHIKVGFFLQFGYPGEGREDIEKTLQMVREGKLTATLGWMSKDMGQLSMEAILEYLYGYNPRPEMPFTYELVTIQNITK